MKKTIKVNRKEYQAMQEELMFARCNRGKKLYTAGSEVWYMHLNEACKGKILTIHIKVEVESIEMRYIVERGKIVVEKSEVFETKKSLLKSL